jgi:ActR/RegA family two-component response regulator
VEVIMLTGHATVETGIEGMKLGAFDYLMKPCDMDEAHG